MNLNVLAPDGTLSKASEMLIKNELILEDELDTEMQIIIIIGKQQIFQCTPLKCRLSVFSVLFFLSFFFLSLNKAPLHR